jgi:hypothetical protein
MKHLKYKTKEPQLIFCINQTLTGYEMFDDPVISEKLTEIIKKYENSSNVSICTYALVNTDFYILLRQNVEEEVSHKTLLSQIKKIAPQNAYNLILEDLDKISDKKDEYEKYIEKLKNKYLHRINDYRQLLKSIKEVFSSWYNGYIKTKHNFQYRRSGSVFNSKYKKVLVEDKMDAAKVISSYIDLLPLRTNAAIYIEKYIFSNFGAALNGNKKAQGRIVDFFNYYKSDKSITWQKMSKQQKEDSWKEYSEAYDNILFEDTEIIVDKNGCFRRGISKERFLEAIESDTKKRFTLNEATHCHTKYFTHGTAFGSKEFCEKTFKQNLEVFSENRKDGARRMLKLNKDIKLFTLRQIHLNVIRPPDYLDVPKELEER